MSASVAGTQQSGTMKSVLGAVDAVRNYQAIAINIVGNVAADIVFYLLVSTRSGILAVFGFLIACLMSAIAFNAAGIVLMDDVRGLQRRATVDAVIVGALATVQAIGVALVGIVIVLAAALVIAALMLICKIPGLGPILFIPVFPVSIVVMGVVLTAMMILLMPVASAAIWSGEGMVQALSRVAVAVKERLVGILIRNLALFLLIGLAGIILWCVLGSGLLATSAMSAGILNMRAGLPSIASVLGGFGEGGGTGSSYLTSALIGGMVLVAIVATLPVVMLQKGWCLIFREMVEDLDASTIEAEMQQRLAEVRQRAAAAQQRIREQTQRTGTAPVPPSTDGTAPGASGGRAAAAACPSCGLAIQASDAFCGNCGAKLH
jgi:hypothetical protein